MPNLSCTISSYGEEMDRYGQPVIAAPRSARCAIVTLRASSEKTTVRADSSASRGSARETVVDARLLFLPIEAVQVNDVVVVAGISVRVIGVFPRFDIGGRHDHDEVDGALWE